MPDEMDETFDPLYSTPQKKQRMDVRDAQERMRVEHEICQQGQRQGAMDATPSRLRDSNTPPGMREFKPDPPSLISESHRRYEEESAHQSSSHGHAFPLIDLASSRRFPDHAIPHTRLRAQSETPNSFARLLHESLVAKESPSAAAAVADNMDEDRGETVYEPTIPPGPMVWPTTRTASMQTQSCLGHSQRFREENQAAPLRYATADHRGPTSSYLYDGPVARQPGRALVPETIESGYTEPSAVNANKSERVPQAQEERPQRAGSPASIQVKIKSLAGLASMPDDSFADLIAECLQEKDLMDLVSRITSIPR